MTKQQSHTDLEQDLNDDYTDAASTRRLNQFDARLGKLERLVEAVRDELGEVSVTLSQTRETYARNNMAGEAAALGTLAKAASATQRRLTPEGLLERAEKVLNDPTQVGMVASYVSAGQLAKAADLLADAEARADQSGEDGALARVQDQMNERSQLATISKMGEQLVALQHALNSALSRLARLEARPAAPAPAPTIAKAARFGKAQQDPRDTAEGLMTRAEGVIDSPAYIGQLSSLAQAGQLDEVRKIVERAELAHESKMKARDRRGF